MASTSDTAAFIANSLRNLALDADGEAFDLLNDAAYLVEAALAAIGYLRNASTDLQTGAPKGTAIRTIDGGINMLERAFADAEQVSA